jgi:hypothetical protein
MPRKKLSPILKSPKDSAKRFAVSNRQSRQDLTDLVEGGWLERHDDEQPQTESMAFEFNAS